MIKAIESIPALRNDPKLEHKRRVQYSTVRESNIELYNSKGQKCKLIIKSIIV